MYVTYLSSSFVMRSSSSFLFFAFNFPSHLIFVCPRCGCSLLTLFFLLFRLSNCQGELIPGLQSHHRSPVLDAEELYICLFQRGLQLTSLHQGYVPNCQQSEGRVEDGSSTRRCRESPHGSPRGKWAPTSSHTKLSSKCRFPIFSGKSPWYWSPPPDFRPFAPISFIL